MSADVHMTLDERRKYLLRIRLRYVQAPRISRSRPWHKNDNRFVEQKNTSLVRAYLGYERLDSVAQAQAANHLYDQMWLYYNFFQPVLRVCEKTLVVTERQRPHIKRRYDTAQTPFDRLCTAQVLSPEQQRTLASCVSRPTRAACTARSTHSSTLCWCCQLRSDRRTSTRPSRP